MNSFFPPEKVEAFESGFMAKAYELVPYAFVFEHDYLTRMCELMKDGIVDEKDKPEFTELLYTSLSYYTELYEYAIQNGINVNAKDKYGWTVLMHAAMDGYEAMC